MPRPAGATPADVWPSAYVLAIFIPAVTKAQLTQKGGLRGP
jgi:hypothetical protein